MNLTLFSTRTMPEDRTRDEKRRSVLSSPLTLKWVFLHDPECMRKVSD